MVGGQGEDSCGLIGRPRKAKSCTASNSGRASSPDCLSLNLIPVVMFQPLFLTSC
ncbi:hypothetical protein [Priestia megaterium]|uniref:hypothetical protein n=1 Tax=Priestia megaterium TaxID=1404 RepID=UPI0003448DB1|nr:hypothetical protein [Priestia megaterium]MCR8927166.1 hypothetical protein [Priestia megaterium]UMZ33826.1 hypothetical protein MGJ28_03765 [Priestia megaterium]